MNSRNRRTRDGREILDREADKEKMSEKMTEKMGEGGGNGSLDHAISCLT